MHFLRPAKKTAYRRWIFLICTLALAMTAPKAFVCAADTEDAAEGAVQEAAAGHVYVRAAVEEGYETEITVTLMPVSKGDHMREYCLSPQNRYGVSDDLAEGSYICVPYITDPEQGGTVYVEYGGGEKEVAQAEAEDSTPSIQPEAEPLPEAEEQAGAEQGTEGKRLYAAAAAACLTVSAAVIYHIRKKNLEQPH